MSDPYAGEWSTLSDEEQDTVAMAVTERMIEGLTHVGMTKKELAQKTRTRYDYVVKWTSPSGGPNTPAWKWHPAPSWFLAEYVRVTGVDATWLLTGKGAP